MSYYGSDRYLGNSDFMLRLRDMKRGNLDLGWLSDARERIEIHPEKPRRGLTVADCEVGPYAIDAQPEVVRDNRAMAPRGALIPGVGEIVRQQPDLGPALNRKSDVWAYRVQSYWEEAVSRQWNATTDIPWQDLSTCEVPEEQELAFCQLCTRLTEVEMIATDLPAKWAPDMNSYFQEVKAFIATQCIDEARHAEVFRKRALANGAGLMQADARSEEALKGILEADSYSEGSVFLHVLGEGFILTLFRFSEFISPTSVDKRMFQLVMQDEARHVSYGLQHLKYLVDEVPDCRPQVNRFLDEAELHLAGLFGPILLESMIILAGKGTTPAAVSRGVDAVGTFLPRTIEEYFGRCDRAGITERRQRSPLFQLQQVLLSQLEAQSA